MITYRSADINDLDGIVRLLSEVLSPYRPSIQNYQDTWAAMVAAGAIAVVAIDEDHIVAYGALIVEPKPRDAKLGHIEDICVDHAYQGRGIGKSIVEMLKKEAMQRKCYKIALACHEKNVKFYESCGFLVDGYSMSMMAGKV